MTDTTRARRRLKLRPMSVADVPTDDLEPLDDSGLLAIELTSARIDELRGALERVLSGTEAKKDRGVASYPGETPLEHHALAVPPDVQIGALIDLLYVNPVSSGQRKPATAGSSSGAAAFTATRQEELSMILQAIVQHRVGKTAAWRVQEDVAINLGLNVGDVAQLEQHCATLFGEKFPCIPPIACLLFIVLTSEDEFRDHVAEVRKKHQSHSVVGHHHGGKGASGPKDAAEQQAHLVARLRHIIAGGGGGAADQEESSSWAAGSGGGTLARKSLKGDRAIATLRDALWMMNFRHFSPAAPWSCSIALLLASIAAMCNPTQWKRLPSSSRPGSAAAQPTVAGLLRPESGSSTSSRSVDQPATSKHLWCKVTFANGEAALQHFTNVVTALDGSPVVTVPLGWRVRLLTARELRKCVPKIARSDASPDVVPTDAKFLALPLTERLGRLTANRNRLPAAAVHFVVTATDSSRKYWTSLAGFSAQSSENEVAIAPFTQLQFTGFAADENRVNFSILTPSQANEPTALHTLFATALSECWRSHDVTVALHKRLTDQFPRKHLCGRHPGQPLANFCHDCDVFICAHCSREKHAYHKLQARAAFCGDERQRLQTKRTVVLGNTQCLEALQSQSNVDGCSMNALIDRAFDAVKADLLAQRQALHHDVDNRAARLKVQLTKDLALCKANRTVIERARAAVSRFRQGHDDQLGELEARILDGTGFMEEPNTAQLQRSLLPPRLPTKAVLQMIDVLTWSNPSQYLTTYVYPPAAASDRRSGETVKASIVE